MDVFTDASSLQGPAPRGPRVPWRTERGACAPAGPGPRAGDRVVGILFSFGFPVCPMMFCDEYIWLAKLDLEINAI